MICVLSRKYVIYAIFRRAKPSPAPIEPHQILVHYWIDLEEQMLILPVERVQIRVGKNYVFFLKSQKTRIFRFLVVFGFFEFFAQNSVLNI